MPRPKKVVADEPKQEVLVEKQQKKDGLIALEHFAKAGTMFIAGESYEIKDGMVQVKPEHVAIAKEHIKLIGG